MRATESNERIVLINKCARRITLIYRVSALIEISLYLVLFISFNYFSFHHVYSTQNNYFLKNTCLLKQLNPNLTHPTIKNGLNSKMEMVLFELIDSFGLRTKRNEVVVNLTETVDKRSVESCSNRNLEN